MRPYRDYDESPLMRFLRFVTKTFAIGDFFGVHVRMYWAAAIVMPWIYFRWVPSGTVLEAVVCVAICFFGLFLIVWTHEMGHIVAGWRYRIRTDAISLSPLGGVAHMNAPATTPRGELVIALAGPATHLLWLAVFWPLSALLPYRVLEIEGWEACPISFAVWFFFTANLSLLLFNLLPFFPLDGGRVLRALLAMRVHPNRATMWATSIGIAGGVGMIVLAMFRPDLQSAIGVLIGLLCVQASLAERQLARHALIYGHMQPDPWAMDPDAWKRGAGPLADPKPRAPGFVGRWLRARKDRRVARAAAADAALDREVDAILDRVHSVGMTGLTDREKAVLKRASQRRRGVG